MHGTMKLKNIYIDLHSSILSTHKKNYMNICVLFKTPQDYLNKKNYVNLKLKIYI